MKTRLRLVPLRSWRLSVPVEHPGLQNIAMVQRGMQIGVLALEGSGQYVQVNGDMIQPLNKAQVLKALRSSGMPIPNTDTDSQAANDPLDGGVHGMAPTAPVPVIVRRKRRIVAPGTPAA